MNINVQRLRLEFENVNVHKFVNVHKNVNEHKFLNEYKFFNERKCSKTETRIYN